MKKVVHIIKKPMFSFIVFAMIVCTGIYFTIQSKVFTVKNIDIVMNLDYFVSEDEIRHIVQPTFGTSIFLVTQQSVKDQILSSNPKVERVYLDKILPDSLLLTIYEYSPGFILVNEGRRYWVLASGDVITYFDTRYEIDVPVVTLATDVQVAHIESSEIIEELTPVPIEENNVETHEIIIPTIAAMVEDSNIEPEIVGELNDFFSEEYVTVLLEIIEQFKQFPFIIDEIKLHTEGVELIVKDDQEEVPWSIWMSISKDLTVQISDLLLLIEDKILNSVHYSSIDLRFNKPVVRYR